MDVESDANLLPRAELVKTIVAALPVPPGQKPTAAAAAADEDGDQDISDSDEGPRLEYVTHLEINCDNRRMAAALSSLEIKLYSADSMAVVGQLHGHTGPITQLAFAPSDASCLFSASEDGTVRYSKCVAQQAGSRLRQSYTLLYIKGYVLLSS